MFTDVKPGDDGNILATPGEETKREGSMISVKEAADTLDSTDMVSGNISWCGINSLGQM